MKNKKSNKPPTVADHKRVLFLSLLIFAFFAILIAQFYQIQMIDGKHWAAIGNKQHYFIVKDPFKRGTFISNSSIKKGHPDTSKSFVIDVQKFHLYADATSIPIANRQEVADNLNEILNYDETEKNELLVNLSKKSRSRKLAMWLDKETHDRLLKWWGPYARSKKIPRNALFFISDYERSYPFGSTLGQVLHTIQKIKDEKTSQAVPTGGLELYFNQYLKGKIGKRRLMRSPRNALETGDVIAMPENGADIYLTINDYLQTIAEEELAKGVKQAKAKSGWALMMDPYTGEILALAQYPVFHPASYQLYFNDPALIENTKVKAITDATEPGSIMKAITIAVALKANEELAKRNAPPLFDPAAMMPTSNSKFTGRKKPLKDTHFHSFLNMDMAIQKSSNIYMARLVEKIIQQFGNEWYRQTLYNDFGVGQRTGIELPSESPGVLPLPGKKHPNGRPEWSASTPYSMAMGHNIQMTSMQVLRAYAMFANGGYLVKPTLVKKIIKTSSDGMQFILADNTTDDYTKKFPRVISGERAQMITKAMKYTTKIGGTARRADIFGYSEAGKSGTADKAIAGGYDPHFVVATFVGIVPANQPAFVLLVAMDEPEYGYEPGQGRKHMGGFCSAPVFREISRRSLEYLGIAPDDPHGYPPGDPRYDANKADWLPELRQLQEKYEKWNNSGH
ncbi:MAG: penicillin-binding protein 2 [Parachlamydiaceae bacterium]